MADTQALNGTFFAFKRRERQGVLTGASIAFIVLSLALFGGFLALNFQLIGALMSWYAGLFSAATQGGPPPDMSSLPAGLGIFFLTLIPAMIAGYILAAAYEAACLRWMIRGETGGFLGLSFGADTWRVYLTYWIWFGLYIAYSMISGLIATIFMFIAIAAGSGDDMSMMGTAFAINLVVRLVLYAVMAYFAVRFAPAAAASVGLKRFAFFESWNVTKGRFWALFGSFFLIYLILTIIEIVLFGAVFVAAIASSGAALGSLEDPQQAQAFFTALFTPQTFVIFAAGYALLLFLSIWVYLATYGVNARAIIAAAEDGKISGVANIGLAETFE